MQAKLEQFRDTEAYRPKARRVHGSCLHVEGPILGVKGPSDNSSKGPRILISFYDPP